MDNLVTPFLEDPALFVRDRAYIGGQWQAAKSGHVFDVQNPATGATIGCVPECGLDDLEMAIDAASAALNTWRDRTCRQRARILHRLYELLVEHKEDLGTIISLENGKARADAVGEVL